MMHMGKYRVQPVPNWRVNPYLDLFYGSMGKIEGVDCEFVEGPKTAREKVLARADAVHFHWPEHIWRNKKSRASPASIFKFWRILRHLDALGLPVLWTAHNLLPHSKPGLLDRWARRLLARQARIIICHGEEAATTLRREVSPSGEVIVMRHGNFKGAFPTPRSPAEVRTRFEFDAGRPLLVMVGLLRDYKGFDTAIAAVKKMPNAQLLIAGDPHHSFNLEALRSLVADEPNIVLHPEHLTNQEIADIYGAADLALLPYTNITGSGVLLTALTLGAAVVASRLAFFEEVLAGHPAAARLHERGDPESLAAAVTEMLDIPRDKRSEAALALAAEYDWERCTKAVEDSIVNVISAEQQRPR